MRFFKNIIFFILSLFIFSVSDNALCNENTGLARTKTDEWVRRIYPKLGISVEMPKSVNVIRFKYGNQSDMYDYASLYFFIHPSHYGYVEPHYVISCFIDILNKKQYKTYVSKDGKYLPPPFNDSIFHKKLKENFRAEDTSPGQYYYRRDFRNEETGDVVLATATYWKTIDPNHEEEDVATIRRILNSVQFISKEEPKQNPDKTANDTENKK